VDVAQSATLGKALSSRGYVIWRPQAFHWIVVSPTQSGRHETVHKGAMASEKPMWWDSLICTCPNGTNPEGPCVHKSAVHQHATNPCEYQYYNEG